MFILRTSLKWVQLFLFGFVLQCCFTQVSFASSAEQLSPENIHSHAFKNIVRTISAYFDTADVAKFDWVNLDTVSTLDLHSKTARSVSKRKSFNNANFFMAIIGVFLIAMASASLAWGVRSQIQLQRDKEKATGEINRLTRELDIAYAKKNQIITTFSHDIRQPLQTLHYLCSGLPEEDKIYSDRFRQIKEVTHDLNELVNALFNISKFDNDLVLPNISIVNIEHVLSDISHAYYSLVTSHGIQLHVNHQNAWLKTDVHLLKHALGVLIENAIKHSSASHIWVEAVTDSDGRTLLKVRDNGKGIPEEKWPIIFDEFYQIEGAEGSQKVGMGLGLALFARISELLDIRFYIAHPKIEVLHETMITGPGIEFVLELPELSLTDLESAVSLQHMEEKRQRRALFENRFENNVDVWIVDSNPKSVSAISYMMLQWGVSTHVFSDFADVKSGLSRLNKPDLILSKEGVSGAENGETLIDTIRAHYENEIEACVISSAVLEASIVRDDIHFLVEPVPPNSIFDILYSVVEYKRNVARKKRFVKQIQSVEE